MTKDDLVSVDDASFEHTVRAQKGRFLLDVTAEWCGPCRAMMPAILMLASERKHSLTVGLLNVDTAPETAIALGIRGAPTLILFEDGKRSPATSAPRARRSCETSSIAKSPRNVAAQIARSA